MNIDLSEAKLEELRSNLWLDTERQDKYLAAIAERIEMLVVGGADRGMLAAELRLAGFGHSEMGLLRRWAIRRSHLALDELLAVVVGEMSGRRTKAVKSRHRHGERL